MMIVNIFDEMQVAKKKLKEITEEPVYAKHTAPTGEMARSNTSNYNISYRNNDPSDTLLRAFDWSDTPQGRKYWSDVFIKLEKVGSTECEDTLRGHIERMFMRAKTLKESNYWVDVSTNFRKVRETLK